MKLTRRCGAVAATLAVALSASLLALVYTGSAPVDTSVPIAKSWTATPNPPNAMVPQRPDRKKVRCAENNLGDGKGTVKNRPDIKPDDELPASEYETLALYTKRVQKMTHCEMYS